jgi:hypothetical protein
MSIDGSSEYPSMAEELDAGEIEGKTKMAFAKMQVPQNVKESHLLSDTDFMLNVDREQEESVNENSSVGELSMEDVEAQEALADQIAALEGGSVGSGGSRSGTPGGGSRAERSQSFKQNRLSRGNSIRSITNSRSNSQGRLPISANNSANNSPRSSSVHLAEGSNSSPVMSTSSSAAVASKRMDKSNNPKKGNGGTHSNASGTTLKPVHPPKEPTMAEQAARLGLFT